MTAVPTEDTVAQNVEVVRRVLEEIWNDGNVDLADELIAVDAIDHDKQPGEADGRESFKEHVQILRGASSNMHLAIDQVWGAGDRVVARWRWQGVQDRPMFDMPPSNKPFDMTTVAIYRVQNGQVTEIWKATDLLQMLEQLEVLPPRGSGPLKTIVHTITTVGRMGVRKARYALSQRRGGAATQGG